MGDGGLRGLHCFVCKRAPGGTSRPRHHALNDMVARAYANAGYPAAKERNGLTRIDGKRALLTGWLLSHGRPANRVDFGCLGRKHIGRFIC